MDKQKQIEELTNKICSVLFIKSSQPNCSDCYFSDDCGYKVLAEELLKHYQPKIPEGTVVVPNMAGKDFYVVEKTEWDKMVQGAKDIIHEREEKAVLKFAEKAKERFTKAKNAYKGASQTVIYHDKMMFHKGEERAMEKVIQFVDEIAKEFTGWKNDEETKTT